MSEKTDMRISLEATVTIPIEEYRLLMKKGAILDMIISAFESDCAGYEVNNIVKYAKRVLDLESLMVTSDAQAKDRAMADLEQGESVDA